MKGTLAALALLGLPGGVFGFEAAPGRIVSAVAMQAAPEDLPRLAPYVEVKRGDPFDPAAVRRSVQLLYATGRFEDVLVEADETADGVALLFHPIPAPLFAAVRVEGDAVLGRGAVRRAARSRPPRSSW